MRDSDLYEAVQLKRDYPEATKGFDIFQVKEIWQDHSQSMAAGWLIPQDAEEVERVFNIYRV